MVANVLSLFRVILIPFIILSLKDPGENALWTTLVLLSAAALSDLADGFVARRFNQVSRIGKILDPLADKVFLISVGYARVLWREFPSWLLAGLVVRDFGIIIAGAFLLGRHELVIPPNRIGKYTTTLLVLTAISFVLYSPETLRQVLVWLSALLLLGSSASYAVLLRKALRTGESEGNQKQVASR